MGARCETRVCPRTAAGVCDGTGHGTCTAGGICLCASNRTGDACELRTFHKGEAIVREGLPGTSMPSFGDLFGAEDIAALRDYVEQVAAAR